VLSRTYRTGIMFFLFVSAQLLSGGALAAGAVKMPTASTVQLRPGAHFRECSNCSEMVVVPAGEFTMGAPPTQEGRYDNQGPQHLVKFAKPFAVAIYDVTRRQYREFLKTTGHQQKSGCDIANPEGKWTFDPRLNWENTGFPQSENDPVLCVSWEDAQSYIEWINEQLPASERSGGRGPYRLMSEAEWEYSARAGSSTTYYWGPRASHDFANYGLDQCGPCGPAIGGRDRWLFTSPVGSFPPNRFGLYDMSGNAWTFVADCDNENYDRAPTDGSPLLTGNCKERMVRGGGWEDGLHYLQLTNRWPSPADKNSPQITFRLARDLK
jgi:formylglycine-generating enzyme required for sulfatase activity